jgi:hypothetical protein
MDMNELLVTFCRTGALGPLELDISAAEVVKRIGKAQRINLAQGDDCCRKYLYPGLSLFLRCREPAERHRGEEWHELHLRLCSITIFVSDNAPLALPEAISPVAIQSFASLGLDDVQHILTEHGVEMIREDGEWLRRTVDHAYIDVSADEGLVTRLEANRREPAGR